MFRLRKFLPVLATLTLFFLMAVFLTQPALYAKSILSGLTLWATGVLPATFPFLFLTALIPRMKPYRRLSKLLSPPAQKLFRVSGAGAGAFLLSVLSGYPAGARTLAELNERGALMKSERFPLAVLCSTSGPTFLVGTVGCMLYRSAKIGWILFLSHILAVMITAFVLRFYKTERAGCPFPDTEYPNAFQESLQSAIAASLTVGGLIALFFCLGDMLSSIGLFTLFHGSPYIEGALRGALEMTTGCAFLAGLYSPLSVALSSATVTFGGACVLLQQAVYLTPLGVKMLPFTLVKALEAGLAFLLALALSLLLGI